MLRSIRKWLPVLMLVVLVVCLQGMAEASILYSNNFDGNTTGSLPASWTQVSGSTIQVTTGDSVSGAKSIGNSALIGTGGYAIYTGMTATDAMTVQFAYRMRKDPNTTSNGTDIRIRLRWSTASGGNFYEINLIPTTSGTAFANVSKTFNGVGQSGWNTGSAGGNVSGIFTDGSVILVKCEITAGANPTIQARWWAQGTTEPSTWLFSPQDTSVNAVVNGTAGFGFTYSSNSTTYTFPSAIDNLYISTTDSETPLIAGTLTYSSISSSVVNLTWPAATTGASPYTYTVNRSLASNMSSPTTLATAQSGTTYSDGTVSASTTYFYQVTYIDTVGTALSNILTATTPASSGPATAYTITAPSPASGPVNYASGSYTVAVNGVLTNGATLVITATDDQGVTTGTSFTGQGAVPNTQTFTYTPTVVGTRTLTFTHTGTATGISDPGTQTYVSLPVIGVTSTAARFSPANWSGDTGRGGSVYRQTWNAGAYAVFQFSDSSGAPAASLLCSNVTAGSTLTYWCDGKVTYNAAVPSPLGNNESLIVLSGLSTSFTIHTVVAMFSASAQSARWALTNAIQVRGLVMAATGSASALTTPAWGLIVGDSITEGIAVSNGNAADFSGLTAKSYLDAGLYDVGTSACGFSGWLTTGDSTADVPSWYFVSGSSGGTGGTYNDSLSRWNKISTGVSLLDSNNHISAYGGTGQEPAWIYIVYGVNEQLNSKNLSDTEASITQWMTAARAAAPSAEIIVQVPFNLRNTTVYAANSLSLTGLDYTNGIIAAYNNYVASNPGDTKIYLSDFGTSLAYTLATSTLTALTPVGVHPNDAGHAVIMPWVSRALTTALAPPVSNNAGSGQRSRGR